MAISSGLGGYTPPGLVLVKSQAFSSATSVDVTNCFNSTYENYRVVLSFTSLSANDTVVFTFRDSGGNVTSANYDWQGIEAYQTNLSAFQSMASGNSRIQFAYTSPGYLSAVIDIIEPNLATRTRWSSNANSTSGTSFVLVDKIEGMFRLTTQFTGLSVTTAGGTATFGGTIRVYGYRN